MFKDNMEWVEIQSELDSFSISTHTAARSARGIEAAAYRIVKGNCCKIRGQPSVNKFLEALADY